MCPQYLMLIESALIFQERVEVKAFSSDGSYYKLSTLLNMTSDRTKVWFACDGPVGLSFLVLSAMHKLNPCISNLWIAIVLLQFMVVVAVDIASLRYPIGWSWSHSLISKRRPPIYLATWYCSFFTKTRSCTQSMKFLRIIHDGSSPLLAILILVVKNLFIVDWEESFSSQFLHFFPHADRVLTKSSSIYLHQADAPPFNLRATNFTFLFLGVFM